MTTGELELAELPTRLAPLFQAPWEALDDQALLAHFGSRREAAFYPVADPDETRPDKIEAMLDGRFEFNGESHQLPDPLRWLENPSEDVEWHILLHKFYYAVGLGMRYAETGEVRYAQRWSRLIDGWIESVPAGFIAADVTGRRVQNWIYSYYYFVATARPSPIEPAFHRRLLTSIAEQVDYLCENLTPARNHRTLELYAIFLASVAFPEMAHAAQWQAFSLARLEENIRTDLLPDGVQIELSSDYHQLVLKNYLNVRRLAAINGIAIAPDMDSALIRALEFSMHVHKPDGIVPSLSDGDARSFLDLLAIGATLYRREDFRYVASGGTEGSPPANTLARFPHAGYTVVRDHWGTGGRRFRDAQYLVFDCGPLGAGNHGHFDCLNFELAAFGRSLVVDPGRYTYSEAGTTNWRIRFRGTEAHNTVSVDGHNQTLYLPRPVKDGTRHRQGSVRHKISGPEPQATMHEVLERDDLVLLHGSVRSHVYDAVHSRRIVFVDRSYWIVSDWLDAPTHHHYALRFQLGEAALGGVERAESRAPLLRTPGLLVAQPEDPAIDLAVESSWISYRYGEKLPAPRLCFRTAARSAGFDTVLLPWEGCSPPLSVRRLEPVALDPAAGPAALIEIETEVGATAFRDLWFHSRLGGNGRWSFDGYEFTGRWLWLREDRHGRITKTRASTGASLTYRGLDVPLAE